MDRVRRLVLGMEARLAAADALAMAAAEARAAEALVTRARCGEGPGENRAEMLPMFDRAPTLDMGLEALETLVRGEVRRAVAAFFALYAAALFAFFCALVMGVRTGASGFLVPVLPARFLAT